MGELLKFAKITGLPFLYSTSVVQHKSTRFNFGSTIHYYTRQVQYPVEAAVFCERTLNGKRLLGNTLKPATLGNYPSFSVLMYVETDLPADSIEICGWAITTAFN